MNRMVLLWMVVATFLTAKSFKRPSYAVALYMMTFFASPTFWWWGDFLENYRWNFYSGVLLIGTLIAAGGNAIKQERPLSSNAVPFLVLMVVNATVVHLMLAVNPDSSIGWLIARVKFILLFFLLQYAIRDEEDYRIVAMAICLGMGYIGYEATINERGSFSGGRLEGIGAAGVQSSNQLASLLVTGLPVAVTLLFTNISKWAKGGVLVACGMTFNVVLMCNSRGSFLGLIAGGLVFLLMASGPARKQSARVVGLALVATFLLLGDPKIVTRFLTTFNSEQRDNSAESRIRFWSAASAMVVDYPLGSGGNSFSEGRGWKYLSKSAGQASSDDQKVRDTRAIHNGFLTEAVDWGVQGFALMLLFIGAVWRTLYRGRALARRADDAHAMMVLACIGAGLAAWMVSSVFGDYLNDEWGFWVTAMAYAYVRVRLFAGGTVSVAADTPAAASALTTTGVWPRPVAP
jgi:putative inorganic carbon (hco3(-)) transporter